jgi:hypothetical protein
MARITTLLTLGRPHIGLLQACLANAPQRRTPRWRPRFDAADLARLARERSRRARSLMGALLLFAGAVLAARDLYLRGEPEVAALLLRTAHEGTLRSDRRAIRGYDAQGGAPDPRQLPEFASIGGRSQRTELPCLPTPTCP